MRSVCLIEVPQQGIDDVTLFGIAAIIGIAILWLLDRRGRK